MTIRTSRGLGRKHIFHAIDSSLRRLGTDYVDLYIIHRLDPETPMEEILTALHDVVEQARESPVHWCIRDVGVAIHEDAIPGNDKMGLTRFSCPCRITTTSSIERKSAR